jgi:hypothetical protein
MHNEVNRRAAAVSPASSRPWVDLLGRATEFLVGSILFAFIAIPAVLLDWAVRIAEAYTSRVIVYGLKGGEYAVFGTDFVLFVIFLLKTAIRTAKRL